MAIILKYAGGWIGLVVIAVLNGMLREKVYSSHMGALSAHQISTVLGLFLFSLYIWLLTGTWIIPSAERALIIGGVWLLLTVLFEFIFGHYIIGHPWGTLLNDYNLCEGRIWILIPLWTAVSPYVFFRLRS